MVGISNADPVQIRTARESSVTRLVSVQNELSPAFRSSLARGGTVRGAGPGVPRLEPARRDLQGGSARSGVGGLRCSGTPHGVSPQQVTLAWELSLSPDGDPDPRREPARVDHRLGTCQRAAARRGRPRQAEPDLLRLRARPGRPAGPRSRLSRPASSTEQSGLGQKSTATISPGRISGRSALDLSRSIVADSSSVPQSGQCVGQSCPGSVSGAFSVMSPRSPATEAPNSGGREQGVAVTGELEQPAHGGLRGRQRHDPVPYGMLPTEREQRTEAGQVGELQPAEVDVHVGDRVELDPRDGVQQVRTARGRSPPGA